MIWNLDSLRLYHKKELDYTEHPVFHKTQDYMLLGLDRLRLASTAKEKMVKEFMRLVVGAYRDTFLEFIENNLPKLDNIDSETIENLMKKSWVKYQKEAELDLIPTMFVDKFDNKYLSYYEFFSKAVRQTCVSNLYDTGRDKFISILDSLDMFLNAILANVIDTANEFNGELDKLLKGSKFDDMM